MNNWIDYKEIDFAGEYAWINIDTRDFHAKAFDTVGNLKLELPPNYKANGEKYFHTPEEVKVLIGRFYNESGGKGEWRMFALEGAEEVTGWDMKYIAIVKHHLGLLVCRRIKDEVTRPLKKKTLALPVKQKYLNHMAD